MNQDKINKILTDLESGYDRMASKFSGTRKFFWRDLEFIAQYIADGDSVLDYGCGNGRLLEILKDKKIDYTGADVSQELVDLAKIRYPGRDFQKISVQDSLPFNDNFFNKSISIAVFHHFPHEHAQKMAEELYRVTKPDGIIIITFWNLWQRRFLKNIIAPAVIWKKIWQAGKYKDLDFKDGYIPFKINDQKEYFERYHRAYALCEIEKIFRKAGFKKRRLETISGKNILYIGQK